MNCILKEKSRYSRYNEESLTSIRIIHLIIKKQEYPEKYRKRKNGFKLSREEKLIL